MTRIFVALLGIVTFSLTGCSGGSSGSPIPVGPKGTVSGVVTLDGKQIQGGALVTFTHQKLGLVASSKVADDGAYQLEMIDTMQIPTGIYKISVVPPGKPTLSPEEAMKLDVEGKLKEEASVIPTKYMRSEESPLKYEVKEGENKHNVEMKSGS